MRVVIQRVSQASVKINHSVVGSIQAGYLILVGIEDKDEQEDIHWLTRKIIGMRLFNDEHDKMNLTLKEVDGNILAISQFTLHASTKKGNRPSYIRAAKPAVAQPLYERFCRSLSNALQQSIETGEFGADMKVELINDGPVTIVIDSKNRE